MTTSFDIDALRAVIAGIEQNSFAKAAVQLGRSQSAISMQLKKLEQQAGTTLFRRKGRGLVPTDAGEALAKYAREIIALNDDAARAIGASVAPRTIRIGLPQDFFDDVMPRTLRAYSQLHPDVHVEVRSGNNHLINSEIDAGRLDVAIAFFPKQSRSKGDLICELPTYWFASSALEELPETKEVPLVLFNHPCLFRIATLSALDQAQRDWRTVLTTPSLSAVWAGVTSGFGLGVRVGHAVPEGIVDVSCWRGLPPLPGVDLRILSAAGAPDIAHDLKTVLLNALSECLLETTNSRTSRRQT